MPKQARFYVIEKNSQQGELSAEEALACDLAANAWRLGKKSVDRVRNRTTGVRA